ncbi:phosphoadenylyl-sulfate reductase [Mangrovicoccus algicola]|uniref:Phosphoadenosine 5'-phosphosulfate reductase n=1 Tax=Mangrovicoccus algicola TaxID=2771008 RepID=A0A8J6ZCT1_9RHOB|nr:phosphoadenylyl-sulfate reductase [Mangrovicoccus algicola]MBE3639941.1 phosphoadenylyl-sulfate reductase [Mangrovicoccus algicola]
MQSVPKPRASAASSGPKVFTAANEWLDGQDAETRIEWALENLPRDHVVSSSFGIQSAVMLHMMTRQVPGIPVLLFDTGYLFPETYRFIDRLTEMLDLNLHVYRAEMTPAWQEARFGKLWTQGEEGLKKYNVLNKVEPMQRAMTGMGAGTWYSGLRRVQSASRAERRILEFQSGRVKFHPIVDWSNRDIHMYLKAHDLPYHPLWEQGYVSVGDTHTTSRLEDGMREEDTRFNGMGRECGLHLDQP